MDVKTNPLDRLERRDRKAEPPDISENDSLPDLDRQLRLALHPLEAHSWGIAERFERRCIRLVLVGVSSFEIEHLAIYSPVLWR